MFCMRAAVCRVMRGPFLDCDPSSISQSPPNRRRSFLIIVAMSTTESPNNNLVEEIVAMRREQARTTTLQNKMFRQMSERLDANEGAKARAANLFESGTKVNRRVKSAKFTIKVGPGVEEHHTFIPDWMAFLRSSMAYDQCLFALACCNAHSINDKQGPRSRRRRPLDRS